MELNTFDRYQTASRLQDQARKLFNRLELLADHDVTKAERLLDDAWGRYNRRTGLANRAADVHWGSL